MPDKPENPHDLSQYTGWLPQRELVILEKFRAAEAELAKNAADWNTPAKAKRKITIELVYDFSDLRELRLCQISSATKLAAPRPFVAKQLYFNEPSAEFVEQDPAQPSFLTEKEEKVERS